MFSQKIRRFLLFQRLRQTEMVLNIQQLCIYNMTANHPILNYCHHRIRPLAPNTWNRPLVLHASSSSPMQVRPSFNTLGTIIINLYYLPNIIIRITFLYISKILTDFKSLTMHRLLLQIFYQPAIVSNCWAKATFRFPNHYICSNIRPVSQKRTLFVIRDFYLKKVHFPISYIELNFRDSQTFLLHHKS